MGKWLKMVQKSENEGGENMVGKNKIGEQGRCKKEGNECIQLQNSGDKDGKQRGQGGGMYSWGAAGVEDQGQLGLTWQKGATRGSSNVLCINKRA